MPHTLSDESPMCILSEGPGKELVVGASPISLQIDPLMAIAVFLKGQVFCPFNGCFFLASSYLGSREVKAAMGGLLVKKN